MLLGPLSCPLRQSGEFSRIGHPVLRHSRQKAVHLGAELTVQVCDRFPQPLAKPGEVVVVLLLGDAVVGGHQTHHMGEPPVGTSSFTDTATYNTSHSGSIGQPIPTLAAPGSVEHSSRFSKLPSASSQKTSTRSVCPALGVTLSRYCEKTASTQKSVAVLVSVKAIEVARAGALSS